MQVENVALLANSRDVGHVGVNLYCDDQAIAKQLPLNPRACQIAECCGKMVQVRPLHPFVRLTKCVLASIFVASQPSDTPF
jgi:hypothetical protein